MKSLIILCSIFLSHLVLAAPFDKTGLIDMKSNATIVGSCFAVTGSEAVSTALGMGNFELVDQLNMLNKTFSRMMNKGDDNYYRETNFAWQETARKLPNVTTPCKNCITASAYCASLLKR